MTSINNVKPKIGDIIDKLKSINKDLDYLDISHFDYEKSMLIREIAKTNDKCVLVQYDCEAVHVINEIVNDRCDLLIDYKGATTRLISDNLLKGKTSIKHKLNGNAHNLNNGCVVCHSIDKYNGVSSSLLALHCCGCYICYSCDDKIDKCPSCGQEYKINVC